MVMQSERFREFVIGMAVVGLAVVSGCRSPYHTDRGALLGGLTGAGVGAAIGDTKGKAAEGALVGSALGALTGAAVGSGLDEMEARHAAMIEEQVNQQRALTTATFDDAISMTQAGLGDEVIIQHFRASGVGRAPNASELIMLKNEGVSDAVIRGIQEAGAAQPIVATPAEPTRVYVQEHYCPAPCPPYRPLWGAHAHWHRRHYHRPRVRWGFSFSH